MSALAAASEWVDEYCEDHFYRISSTRRFDYWSSTVLKVPSLVSVTTLSTDNGDDGTYSTTWTVSTDFELAPFNANTHPDHKPYTEIIAVGGKTFPCNTKRQPAQIVGAFGWPQVPTAITEATMLMADKLYERKDSVSGILGESADFGAIRVPGALDPDIARLLSPYRRNPVKVA